MHYAWHLAYDMLLVSEPLCLRRATELCVVGRHNRNDGISAALDVFVILVATASSTERDRAVPGLVCVGRRIAGTSYRLVTRLVLTVFEALLPLSCLQISRFSCMSV